jgi:hypothetical protein
MQEAPFMSKALELLWITLHRVQPVPLILSLTQSTGVERKWGRRGNIVGLAIGGRPNEMDDPG